MKIDATVIQTGMKDVSMKSDTLLRHVQGLGQDMVVGKC